MFDSIQNKQTNVTRKCKKDQKYYVYKLHLVICYPKFLPFYINNV